ncbi:MAG: sigma-70 family RNA polymerase sigma factor [Clostridia bacterium]|nr:sigma-70 family RNA polymerase sigma factor [Clostridia bacterium]
MMNRNEFIEQNLGLVYACANRFRNRGIEFDDLYSAGCIGLVKATDNFDESRGVCFSTYAVPVILGEIKKIFRDGSSIKVSRSMKELALKIHRTVREFQLVNGYEPSVSQLSEMLCVDTQQIVQSLNATLPPTSLTADNDNDEKQFDIPVSSHEEKITELLTLRQIVTQLDDDEKMLIRLRFFQNKTQTETGKILSMSQVQVSRKEKKILEKLRNYWQ